MSDDEMFEVIRRSLEARPGQTEEEIAGLCNEMIRMIASGEVAKMILDGRLVAVWDDEAKDMLVALAGKEIPRSSGPTYPDCTSL